MLGFGLPSLQHKRLNLVEAGNCPGALRELILIPFAQARIAGSRQPGVLYPGGDEGALSAWTHCVLDLSPPVQCQGSVTAAH